MTQSTQEKEALVRRVSADINQFKTNHHLPDDLESSKRFYLDLRLVLVFRKLFLFRLVTGAISHLQKQAQEVMRQKPKWQTYFQGQMIAKDDYEFMSNFDQLNADDRAKLLSDPNSRNQVNRTFQFDDESNYFAIIVCQNIFNINVKII